MENGLPSLENDFNELETDYQAFQNENSNFQSLSVLLILNLNPPYSLDFYKSLNNILGYSHSHSSAPFFQS